MTDQEKAFIQACIEEDISSVKTCIKYGVDIHVEDDWCIEVAARKGHFKLVRYLLNHGISHESASKKSVLAYAAHFQDVSLVELLINSSDEYKQDNAALTWAASTGNIQIVEYLLPYVTGYDGVFCRAAEAGHINLLQYLIDNQIQDYDEKSHVSVFWAASRKKWSAVHFLIENGIGTIDDLGDKYKVQYVEWRKKC